MTFLTENKTKTIYHATQKLLIVAHVFHFSEVIEG